MTFFQRILITYGIVFVAASAAATATFYGVLNIVFGPAVVCN